MSFDILSPTFIIEFLRALQLVGEKTKNVFESVLLRFSTQLEGARTR